MNEIPCGEIGCNDDFGGVIIPASALAAAVAASGITGPAGTTGAAGPAGPAGPSGGSLAFADFFALMPGDNAATVAVGAAVEFPQDGPNSASGISRLTASTFNLLDIGTYRVNWQVSVDEPGQLALADGGVKIPETVVGRATGTTQIVGSRLITTSVPNTVLSVVNPTGNAAALTITPIAGGTNAVSASLVIERIA